MMTDKKALKILFDTYWSESGWKEETVISPENFSYAQNAGVMFQSVSLSHDDLMSWLHSSLISVSLENITNAFLASLRTRQLEYRSALGSFAFAKNFPNHVYQSRSYCCSICGTIQNPTQSYDLSVFNFERYKWGGVRHERPEYIAFDLEQFAKLDRLEPTEQDIDVMQQIIQVIHQCKPSDKPRDLEQKLSPVFKSNKAEREILIQILAYCGILQPSKRSGYFQSFTNYFDREIPPANKIDWTYPVCWWRGADGINQSVLEYYFPQLTKGG
jgi:hypothetical protein